MERVGQGGTFCVPLLPLLGVRFAAVKAYLASRSTRKPRESLR